MGMNITGLDLSDVIRLFRLGEQTIARLSDQVREANRYATFLEAELEVASPECPACLQIRRDSGGTQRLPRGKHHSDCPCSNRKPLSGWNDQAVQPPQPWTEWDDYAACWVCRSCGAAACYQTHAQTCPDSGVKP